MGAKTLGIASFYLRAVCQNRNLWGVEDFQEITIRHSKHGNRPVLAAMQDQAAAFSGMIFDLGVQFHGSSSSRRLLM